MDALRTTTIFLRALAGAGVVAAVAVTAVSALAAGSSWTARANATCRALNDRSAPPAATPVTLGDAYRAMVAAAPFERAELRDLRRLAGRRPPGAAHALSLAALNIRQLDAAIAAYRSGNVERFLQAIGTWQSDRRVNRAFAALGADDCA